MTAPLTRVRENDAHAFVIRALTKVGVSEAQARDVANLLTTADLRGIESHGIARLRWFYVDRIRNGGINPNPAYRIVRETPVSVLIDADNGLGHPVSVLAMKKTIEKARERGIAFGAVRNSNHYGIAAHYAMMALEHDMIGMSSTDSAHFAIPTYGRDKMQGTNPFAFAVPTDKEPAFVLDFATTTVTYGKLEVYERRGLELKPGWAVDRNGAGTGDPTEARFHGALTPLGGIGVENGGHKGYGLGALSEILCGVLAGGIFGTGLSLPEGLSAPGGITSHWFGALRVDALRDVADFKRDMDRELRMFKDSAKAPGQDRIYVSGEIEHEKTVEYLRDGVPVLDKVWADLDAMADEIGIPRLERFTVG
ncbi:MAG: Ldh family oxidoreductase [Candidatus Velthaea sp.]|jgi:LDH2 family malate/lactate/ureidoglycolate dehydrogenase